MGYRPSVRQRALELCGKGMNSLQVHRQLAKEGFAPARVNTAVRIYGSTERRVSVNPYICRSVSGGGGATSRPPLSRPSGRSSPGLARCTTLLGSPLRPGAWLGRGSGQ